MKNLKKLSRTDLKNVTGAGSVGPVTSKCSYKCCPDEGRPKCPGLICPPVACPQI
ncbi:MULTISPECIES: bacteriocin-like protein [Chryseobacterium]|uniref:Bacteriocin n=1 Tax=Chryseobacterium camelliae TaxID=1265445 RepID=A0ABU0TFZ1_9FLAO|nr:MULTISPECIES: hypothetical protein [Chryseobacterium]MDT3406486.1 hypothetical protein [Pseudacidovorax intermedius]MDQ1095716.1 hypothetical protein [Chryseobacterium camelliae]MDQ1099652.1 hypothetical protein [Chryseobacterium sp. SORGH_AS_1048]MDR6087001.1 hypothetical protein [Chryseobacterium sp. SORGH_AS_0909]MDR6131373.1 hypothetical protein [Chryseobacterium sp. SORGH_AS_1175]